MHAYRSHTCGALRADAAGTTARLSGWIHRKRDHGGLRFIDLRDHGGLRFIDLRDHDGQSHEAPARRAGAGPGPRCPRHAGASACSMTWPRSTGSQAQVALAWQFGKAGITARIASATSLEQFAALVKAASLRLAAADAAALDQASAV